MKYDLNFPRAHGFERVLGRLKKENSDFIVTERLPEQPSGEGEHLWLLIRKDGQNTQWVARQLAKWAQCQPRDVSFAGLKDRHAVTDQTFSIHLPGKETPNIESMEIEGVTVLDVNRHSRKLKTGHLVGNRFEIRIRDHQVNLQQLEANWNQVCEKGVPNYFGPQRFGNGGKNVESGIEWLCGRQKPPRNLQSIYLSSVRSFLFNKILAKRVETDNWDKLLEGDFAQFTEGKTGFYCETVAEDDHSRCIQGIVSPAGSLPGDSRDEFPLLDQRENEVLGDFNDILKVLKEKRVSRHFRKLRVIPEKPEFKIIEGDPVFSFFLPAGCFATSVLEELVDWQSFGGGAVDWNE